MAAYCLQTALLRMDMSATYYAPTGGHPGQEQLLTDRAVFTDAYAVIPKGTMRDIVTSFLPFWEGTRLWVLSRPLSGFAETFSQYIMEVAPGGGSDRPETDPGAQGVLFVVAGTATLRVAGQEHDLTPGGYAYLPAGKHWTMRNTTKETLRFHWIRKSYEAVEGLDLPDVVIANENDIAPTVMPDTDGKWATTRFVDPNDLRHDMHVTVVTFEPGAVIPFLETHVMEHGLYVLRARRPIGSIGTGSKSKRAITCGCGRSARRPVTPAGRASFAICSTRT